MVLQAPENSFCYEGINKYMQEYGGDSPVRSDRPRAETS
jgi:hypothetical protein